MRSKNTHQFPTQQGTYFLVVSRQISTDFQNVFTEYFQGNFLCIHDRLPSRLKRIATVTLHCEIRKIKIRPTAELLQRQN